jgi:hypothetical protein
MGRRKVSIGLVILGALLLTSCGLPTGNERPEDVKLREGIKSLISQYETKFPKSVNWDSAKVTAQISRRLPDGLATEAGWSLKWPNYVQGELASAVVPWIVLGQFPEKFALDVNSYKGGTPVASGIAAQIVKLQDDLFGGSFFAAVVNIRLSKNDPRWMVFTTVPYLPVTDPAYGFAESVSRKWEIKDFGTATVGCNVVPSSVQREFGFTCSPR